MRPEAVRRALDAELAAARERGRGRAPRVLDVGGGSGVWAVQLAASGCEVTVVEPSPNALAILHRRAVEADASGRITAVQGDTEALGGLVPPAEADLVLGHGVLEQVDDVPTALAALRTAAVPGGAVSVLVANLYAAILHRALAGRLTEALRLLTEADARVGATAGAWGARHEEIWNGEAGNGHPLLPTEQVLRRFDTEGLHAVLTAADLRVELLQGDGVVADLVPGAVLESYPSAAEALAQLELLAANRPPLRDLATRLHAIARRPS
ncbi:MAG: class I SAM-dependent methyltransferase [Sciscionella sp.]